MMRRKMIMLLMAVSVMCISGACGTSPVLPETQTSSMEDPAGGQTESAAVQQPEDALEQTRQNLEACIGLIGKDDASSAELLGGGAENIAADGETQIGRIYQAVLFGEETKPATMYDGEGFVYMISISMGNPDAKLYSEQLRQLYGEPAEVNDTPSESGGTWEAWDMGDNVRLLLNQGYGFCSIEIMKTDPVE